MPWDFLLYGLFLPLSLAGLALAVYANFSMQRLGSRMIALPERAKAQALEDIEARPDWRKLQRLMWVGVGLVLAPTLLLLAALTWSVARSSQHHIGAISPVAFLPLMLVMLPLITSNHRRRLRLMQKAGIDTSPTFSAANLRKLEALKRTPEWRALSRETWIASGFMLAGALAFGVIALAAIFQGVVL